MYIYMFLPRYGKIKIIGYNSNSIICSALITRAITISLDVEMQRRCLHIGGMEYLRQLTESLRPGGLSDRIRRKRHSRSAVAMSVKLPSNKQVISTTNNEDNS